MRKICRQFAETWPNDGAAANGPAAVHSSVAGHRERAVRSSRAGEAVAGLGPLAHYTHYEVLLPSDC